MKRAAALAFTAFTAWSALAAQAAPAEIPIPPPPQITIPARVCDVTAHGADGERQQIALNTQAVQAAIDACAAQGGGTVRVPAGNYLVAPLVLRSHIRLLLERGATLVASTEEASYRPEGVAGAAAAENGWRPFISIAQAREVEISGEGTIDGQGAVWWERWRAVVRADARKRPATDRPRLIYARDSQQLRITGVSLLNSPSFHIVVHGCEDVEVHRVRIATPGHAPNTDGIDPSSSRRVRITWNDIDNNDDHVAIKSNAPDARFPQGATAQVYIAHNTLRQGRGISIGSETSGGVHQVLAEHNRFIGSMYGLRIKSPRGKGGWVHDIVFRDTQMQDVRVPLVFSGYYQGSPADAQELARQLAAGSFVVGDQIYPPDTDAPQPVQAHRTPRFSGVTVQGLRSSGNSRAAGYIVGLPEMPIEGLRLEDVDIEATQGLLVRHAQVQASGLQLRPRQGPALLLQRQGVVEGGGQP